MNTTKRAKKPRKTAAEPLTMESKKPNRKRPRVFGFYLSDAAREGLNRYAEYLTRELRVPVSASSALERLLCMISPDGQFPKAEK